MAGIEEVEDPYDDLHIEKFKAKYLIRALVALILIGTTLAASITINSGNKTEFGQGVYQVAACDFSISTNFIANSGSNFDADGAGAGYIKELEISGLDTASCAGKKLTFKFFKSQSNWPRAIYLRKLTPTSCVGDSDAAFPSAAGSKACDGRVDNNDGNEHGWISFTDDRFHRLFVTFASSETVTAVGMWGRADDNSLTMRRIYRLTLCPAANTGISGACTSTTPMQDEIASADFTGFDTNVKQYPRRFGPFFPAETMPNESSRYWRIVGLDAGDITSVAQANYYCGAYYCSQNGEVEFFSGTSSVVLKVANNGTVTAGAVSGDVSSDGSALSSTPNTEINLYNPSTGKYRVWFRYPMAKSSEITNLTIETS
jgi:hypothetical protein